MGKTAVIQCATPPEFEALREAFGRPAVEKAGKRRFFRSSAADCVVLYGSVGKVWAAASAEFAIARWSPALVVDFGAAGALVEGLEVGDLVVAEKVIEHDVDAAERGLPFAQAALGPAFAELHTSLSGRCWFESVPRYPEFVLLEWGARATRGRIAAGDKDVQLPEDRARLAASIDALAATWESSAIGRVCKFHGVPYLSIRVITDRGQQELLTEYKAGVARVLAPAARALAGVFAGVNDTERPT